ncbi:MAG: DUF1254 domain-containing protein [Planctomycetes bacterium]|nr:DUF1254 domain-containing protein [Planctomycetota bacterium]
MKALPQRLAGVAVLCHALLLPAPARAQTGITPAEVRAIAREAYVYGFPMVDSYRIQHAYFVDSGNPEFKAPWNRLRHFSRVYSPEDKAVQSPNSDTPYSFLGMDLRAEPMVLTAPPIEKERYFSIQLVDAYTFNFAYIGSRTTGNGGGHYLIAGPSWRGEKPPGVVDVIRAETDLVIAAYRTQLFDPADIETVKRVQAGYEAKPLSAFLGSPAPAAAPPIDFIAPLTPQTQRSSPEFFNVLSFVLRFCPTHPSERALMERFAKIGVGAGKKIDVAALPEEMRAALVAGMADAWAELAELKKRIAAKEIVSGDLFGTREYLGGNHLYRMAAAELGIYGNSKLEAMYPIYSVDAEGNALDGTRRYAVRFPPGQLPPVHAFWSLTMYEMPASLLTPNPLNRYLLNSPMLPQFARDADGGLTLLIQHESPGKDKESNWLPAPKGPFMIVLRLYWPKDEALDGTWQVPPLRRLP